MKLNNILYSKVKYLIDLTPFYSFAEAKIEVEHDKDNWAISRIVKTGQEVILPENIKKLQELIEQKTEQLNKLEESLEVMIRIVKNDSSFC